MGSDNNEIIILRALVGEDDIYGVNIRSIVEQFEKDMRLSCMKEYKNKMENKYNFK